MARNPQKRAYGGGVFYEGGNSNVAKEAASTKSGFKRGGKIAPMDNMKSAKRMDKRARGGGVKRASGGSVKSSAGGGSADKSPFSSAKC